MIGNSTTPLQKKFKLHIPAIIDSNQKRNSKIKDVGSFTLFKKKSTFHHKIKSIKSLQHHTEAELLELMQQGSRLAFNEIYERFWFKLFSIAAKRINSRDDAKDLVQDLFFSLWMKRHSIVISTSLSAYLFSAIKYKIINNIESRMVKENYLDSLNKAVIDYDNSTHDTIINSDLEHSLDIGINQLSPKVKEVFVLSRKENLSINEIAERLNLSDQTVKNQISKAIRILRIHLSDFSATLPFIVPLLLG